MLAGAVPTLAQTADPTLKKDVAELLLGIFPRDVLGYLIILFLLVLAVLWLLLPFAVFGIKSRLDKMNETLSRIEEMTNENLGAQQMEVTCPKCKLGQTVRDVRDGTQHKCSGCGTEFVIS